MKALKEDGKSMVKIDMDMPKSCSICPLRDNYGWCIIMANVPAWIEDVEKSVDKRSEYCPLIPEEEKN